MATQKTQDAHLCCLAYGAYRLRRWPNNNPALTERPSVCWYRDWGSISQGMLPHGEIRLEQTSFTGFLPVGHVYAHIATSRCGQKLNLQDTALPFGAMLGQNLQL